MQVEIVGGGMVGLAFAIAVKRALPEAGVRVMEARAFPAGSPQALDSRATALNLASRDILHSWGIWEQLEQSTAEIESIHVSSQGRFGSALMEAGDVGEAALGYVTENHCLGALLLQLARACGVVFEAPAGVEGLSVEGGAPVILRKGGERHQADLVIIADGAASSLARQLGITSEKREVHQRAVATNVRCEGEHRGIAWERFTANGPIALLPLPQVAGGQCCYNLIWSMLPERCRSLEAGGDDVFLEALQREIGWRVGRLTAVGHRTVWDLVRVRAREQVRPGVVIAGNAAHSLHPVAGQGFNLSLRDANALASVLAAAVAAGERPGSMNVLQRYDTLTSADQHFTTGATDMLATLFRARGPLLDVPRDTALATLDLLLPLRRKIAQHGTGRHRGSAVGHPG